MLLVHNSSLLKLLSIRFNHDLNNSPLFYAFDYSLRFDLHSEGHEIDNIIDLTKRVFELSLSSVQEVSVLLSFWTDSVQEPSSIDEFKLMVDDLHLGSLGTIFEYCVIGEDTDSFKTCILFKCPKDHELVNSLLNMSITSELGSYKGYNPRVYYISPLLGIIINVYDDRGMDVISTSKEMLDDVYAKFYNNLLSYDIEKMRRSFDSNSQMN